jgi:hypothetical protein
MSAEPGISVTEIIKIFNHSLDNELKVRYINEQDIKQEIALQIIKLSKILRLSTLFTRNGLEYITDFLEKDPKFFNFIIDLTDVFTFRICDIKDFDVENKLIKAIAVSASYKSDKSDFVLFGDKYNNNFSSVPDIVDVIKHNRWLISIAMIRFLDDPESIEKK